MTSKSCISGKDISSITCCHSQLIISQINSVSQNSTFSLKSAFFPLPAFHLLGQTRKKPRRHLGLFATDRQVLQMVSSSSQLCSMRPLPLLLFSESLFVYTAKSPFPGTHKSNGKNQKRPLEFCTLREDSPHCLPPWPSKQTNGEGCEDK